MSGPRRRYRHFASVRRARTVGLKKRPEKEVQIEQGQSHGEGAPAQHRGPLHWRRRDVFSPARSCR
eukprot:8982289-Pyramimonas_sp.AAC.1